MKREGPVYLLGHERYSNRMDVQAVCPELCLIEGALASWRDPIFDVSEGSTTAAHYTLLG